MATTRRPNLGLYSQRRHRADYPLLILSLIFITLGLVVVYSISPSLGVVTGKGENYYASKQLVAVALSLLAFIICTLTPITWFRHTRKGMLVMALAAAGLVQLLGQEANGATRWIQVGGFSFQAAELIKFTLVIWLAGFLSSKIKKGEVGDDSKTLKPILYLLLVIGIIVAGLESDLGSAGVMVMIVGIMIYMAGVPLKRIAKIGALVAIGLILAISSSAYRRDRLATFLNPAQDCQSTGYQACQALITLGSGGMFGLGLGRSVQAAGYLPEAANDSIFAILGEKFGFVGLSFIMGLYIALFTRLKRLIERSEDIFNRLVITGVLAWLSTQMIINIGAMLGLLPLKGITLPLISYGGTSMVFVMAALGLVFQISRYSAYSNIQNERTGHDNSAQRRRHRRPHYANSGRSS